MPRNVYCFERLHLHAYMLHEMQAATRNPPYFNGEKSVGSRYTDSTFSTILPFFSDSAATFKNSGSLRNSAQFFSAAARLGWASR